MTFRTEYESALYQWVKTALDAFKVTPQTTFPVLFENQETSGGVGGKGAPQPKAPYATLKVIEFQALGQPETQTINEVHSDDEQEPPKPLYKHRIITHAEGRVSVQTFGQNHREMMGVLRRSVVVPSLQVANSSAGLSILRSEPSVDTALLVGIPWEPRTATEFRFGFAEQETVGVPAVEEVEPEIVIEN